MVKKIYLFCSAGMSTSLLASNMQEVADRYKLPVKVKAYSIKSIDETYETEHPDCILLGPQVKYLFDEIYEKYTKLHTPVSVIDPNDYGMVNGERVLKQAVKLIKQQTL